MTMPVMTSGIEYEAVDIPLNADGTVLLGTVEAAYAFYPERMVMRFTEGMTGLIVTGVSVGTNAPYFNNIVGALSLLAVSANTARQVDIIGGGGLLGAIVGEVGGGTEIRARVEHTLGSGGKASVSVIGFLEPT